MLEVLRIHIVRNLVTHIFYSYNKVINYVMPCYYNPTVYNICYKLLYISKNFTISYLKLYICVFFIASFGDENCSFNHNSNFSYLWFPPNRHLTHLSNRVRHHHAIAFC